jgi:hypothetical protein
MAPKRVLDLGCGFGKYGVLLREYLDVAKGRARPDQWTTEIVAIEGFHPNRNPIHDFVYNQVHYGNAVDILPGLGQFDLVLMCDVIEHFEKDVAARLVEAILGQARFLVVSTPRQFSPQGAENGNPYQIHRCVWSARDFPEGSYVHTTGAVDCLIFTVSKDPIPPHIFSLTEPADHLYLRMRYQWGWPGAPVSLAMRSLNRLLGRR